jgi:hypothetical protein
MQVIANLAAEEENQVNIVAEGGLEALFELLQTCEDEMTLRVAAGAIANLAMSEANQHRIVAEGGLDLLVHLAGTAQDPQTQRMVRRSSSACAPGLQLPREVTSKGSPTHGGCTAWLRTHPWCAFDGMRVGLCVSRLPALSLTFVATPTSWRSYWRPEACRCW